MQCDIYCSGGRGTARNGYDGGVHGLAAEILPLLGRWIDMVEISIARIVVHSIHSDYLYKTSASFFYCVDIGVVAVLSAITVFLSYRKFSQKSIFTERPARGIF